MPARAKELQCLGWSARMFLGHRAGLLFWRMPVPCERWLSAHGMCPMCAAQEAGGKLGPLTKSSK